MSRLDDQTTRLASTSGEPHSRKPVRKLVKPTGQSQSSGHRPGSANRQFDPLQRTGSKPSALSSSAPNGLLKPAQLLSLLSGNHSTGNAALVSSLAFEQGAPASTLFRAAVRPTSPEQAAVSEAQQHSRLLSTKFKSTYGTRSLGSLSSRSGPLGTASGDVGERPHQPLQPLPPRNLASIMKLTDTHRASGNGWGDVPEVVVPKYQVGGGKLVAGGYLSVQYDVGAAAADAVDIGDHVRQIRDWRQSRGRGLDGLDGLDERKTFEELGSSVVHMPGEGVTDVSHINVSNTLATRGKAAADRVKRDAKRKATKAMKEAQTKRCLEAGWDARPAVPKPAAFDRMARQKQNYRDTVLFEQKSAADRLEEFAKKASGNSDSGMCDNKYATDRELAENDVRQPA